MLARCYSLVMTGLKGTKVEVEVDGTRGQPSLIIIGLPSRAVDEAKERVSAALQHCGIRIRSIRTVVNLAPAEIQKTSSALELAIAVGLLKLYGEIHWDTEEAMFLGELSLDGALKPVVGLFPMVLAAKELGVKKIFFPQLNSQEVAAIEGVALYPVSHLRELLNFHLEPILPLQTKQLADEPKAKSEDSFSQLVGQEQAKRALQIAAAGQHNMLLIGSPGAGKSTLARAMKEILPPLNKEEAMEVTQVYSLRGLAGSGLMTQRPFREPHHTTSAVGLVGGGRLLKPGEVSLAHQGVLFLDEFPEYPPPVLEALRQPMEDGRVTITRAAGTADYPARFMLVAAANPCPCGYHYHPSRKCHCSPRQITSYKNKISGPILDRIDLQLKVQSVDPSRFTQAQPQGQTATAREAVVAAQQIQFNRQGTANAWLSYRQLQQLGNIEQAVWGFLSQAAKRLTLSSRGYLKVLRVSRTIADLAGSSSVAKQHAVEALAYRIS